MSSRNCKLLETLIGECTNQHEPTSCNRPNKQNTSTKQTEHYYLSQSILWSPFADGDQLDDHGFLRCHWSWQTKMPVQSLQGRMQFAKNSAQVKCQLNLFIYKNNRFTSNFTSFHPKNTLTLVFPPDMPLEPAALLAVCARDAVPWLLGRGEPGEGERRRLRAPRNLATLTMGSPVPDSSGKLGWMVGWHLMKHRTSLVELINNPWHKCEIPNHTDIWQISEIIKSPEISIKFDKDP